MRSNPFPKSTENQRTHELPRSRGSNTMCSRYTKACWVDFPETANCLGFSAMYYLAGCREREPFHYLCDVVGGRYRPQFVFD